MSREGHGRDLGAVDGVTYFLCSAQRKNMEFRLAGRSDRHFLNPFSGFENRPNSRVGGYWAKKFRIDPFLKGSQVSKGQSPLLAQGTDMDKLFTASEVFLSTLFRAAEPKK